MPIGPVEIPRCGNPRPAQPFSVCGLVLADVKACCKAVIPPHRNRTPKIRLASYNIHLGIGRDRQFDLERIARVIDELDADVVALQEVALGGPGIDMLEFLGKRCGMAVIAGPTLMTSTGAYGNAMLTRMPAAAIHRWNLSVGSREPRGAIDAHFHHCGMTLRVVGTHLGLWPAERRRQIRLLLDIIKKDNRFPTVLLGDVNEWFLWGRPLRWMHRYFKSTPAPATFPSGRPVFALDRIWVDPRTALQSIAAHTSAMARIASDHLPIVAGFQFGAVAGTAAPARQMATAG